MKKKYLFFVVPFILFVLLWLNSLLAQKIKIVDGITVVMNGKKPNPPAGRSASPKLTEELVLGLAEKPEESFSQVGAIEVDKSGHIYVSDTKDKRIKVFNPEGQLVRTIGQPGQGPGEFETPLSLHWSPRGELMVEDAQNKRLAFFNPAGKFLNQISYTDKLILMNLKVDKQGNILAQEMTLAGNGIFYEIKKFDPQLKPLFSLDKFEFTLPLLGGKKKMNPFDSVAWYEFDPSGQIYYARMNRYEIKIFTPEGKQVRTIQKEYDLVKITPQDEEDFMKLVSQMSPSEVNLKEIFELPDYFPPLQNFILHESGAILVRTYQKGKIKNEYKYELFNPEGVFVGEFFSPATLLLWRGEKLYGSEETEKGFLVVKRYRLSW